MRRGVKVSGHDERLFARAMEIALLGEHHRVRVGAVLCKGHRTVASAANKIGPLSGEPFKRGHAERLVIDRVAAMNGTLYVARLDLNGEPMASWPCDTCMMHIGSCECVTKICYYDGQALVKVRL